MVTNLQFGCFGTQIVQLLLGNYRLLWSLCDVVQIGRRVQIRIFGGVEDVLEQPRESLVRARLHQLFGAQFRLVVRNDLAFQAFNLLLRRRRRFFVARHGIARRFALPRRVFFRFAF